MSHSIVKTELAKAVLKMDKHLTEVWDDVLDTCEVENPRYQMLQEICDDYWYPVKWASNDIPVLNEYESEIIVKALMQYAKFWREQIEKESFEAELEGKVHIFHPNFAKQTTRDLLNKLEPLAGNPAKWYKLTENY